MRVVVNYDTCNSNGVCVRECPEVFEIRDDGYLYLLTETPDESLRPKVEAARDGCPTASIEIED